MIQVLVILVITGPRRSTPANANILVGVSFFASAPNVMILFREETTCYPFSEQLFSIDAKGAFDALKPGEGINLPSWESLPTFDSEAEFDKRCGKLAIDLPHHDRRQPFQSAI